MSIDIYAEKVEITFPSSFKYRIITFFIFMGLFSLSFQIGATSEADFMVHGTMRGLAGSLLEIDISGVGSQSLYALEEGQMESFSVGASGGDQVVITRSGTVTGFITIQTISGAEANCVPL